MNPSFTTATMRSRNSVRSARASVLAGVIIFLALQVLLTLWITHCQVELRDPEYGFKLANLRKMRQEDPCRPLAVVLGSSRALMGIRPGVLQEQPGFPLLYNFALSGSGPVQELLCLRRLLADGVQPDLLLVEVFPPLLADEDEDLRIPPERLSWKDYQMVSRYASRPDSLSYRWWTQVIAPCHSHRFAILSRCEPHLVTRELRSISLCQGFDEHGWYSLPWEDPPKAVVEQEKKRVLAEYLPRINGFRITSSSDRALRELLTLAKQEGIPVVLFWTPEDSFFRGLYPPDAEARIHSYLAGICETFDVPLHECRTWLPDAAFLDGHHLLPRGARQFTVRFVREILGNPRARAVTAGWEKRAWPAPSPS